MLVRRFPPLDDASRGRRDGASPPTVAHCLGPCVQGPLRMSPPR